MESWESAPTEKNAHGNAVNLAKERENPHQIIHQIPIMSTFFFTSKHNKERRQKEKENQQQTKRKKKNQTKKKSRYAVSHYAVTPLPVTPLRVLLTTMLHTRFIGSRHGSISIVLRLTFCRHLYERQPAFKSVECLRESQSICCYSDL